MIVLAHPLTQRWELPVSPLFVSAVALCVLVAVAWVATRREAAARPGTDGEVEERTDEPVSGAVLWGGRTLGLALFVLAIAAGLFGDESQLSNITPALVMGAGWPLLVLFSAAFGRVWEALNPFDTLARVVAPLGAGDGGVEAGRAVWALPAAALWLAYLTMWPNHLAPRSIATAMLIYTVGTLAGCLAVGRRTWLHNGEVFTVFFGLISNVRRHGTAAPVHGDAIPVLAALCGGFTYGLLRDSQLLINLGYGPRTSLYSALALAACVLVAVAAAVAAHRRARARGSERGFGVALVVAAVALALALAFARNRFTTSLQLLPVLASDPFGLGWNVFGTRDWILNARPLGVAGLIVAQLVVIVAGAAFATIVAARTSTGERQQRRRALAPSTQVLVLFAVVSTAAVAATALS